MTSEGRRSKHAAENALELDRTYGPVKPATFAYHAPRTVEEVVHQLAEFAPLDGRILAGGQSLVPMMAFRMARPAHLIDINGVEGLERLSVDDDALRLIETPDYARPGAPPSLYIPPAPFDSRQEGVLWITPMRALAADTVVEDAARIGHL